MLLPAQSLREVAALLAVNTERKTMTATLLTRVIMLRGSLKVWGALMTTFFVKKFMLMLGDINSALKISD
ncbi:hypothetical protein SGGMMB4_04482 [Sodalis glossinidius str. 'morsitans']|uniref:Uncharacterized protein n=1 Tax=Sodalis glossinidius (strain morsitans) TaxID=343509 RepID=A0A193QGX7_SODGM|nr:hypothetical protein SGGMMB4_01121 [Sodalis glossinidius str. 'morsitans']CRL46135.1 hypothetical protein SGGMMB4_04482 [Sodalis glossinidius str. 'morsitans']